MLLWVRTRKNFYQVDVLSAENRNVLVRGGQWLRNWTPATLKGTRDNRPLDDASAIRIGHPLVLSWNGQTIVTSPVVSVEAHVNPRFSTPPAR